MASRLRLVPAVSNAIPEGPYEISGREKISAQSNRDNLAVVAFLHELREEARVVLPLDNDLRQLRIVLELVRNHLTGRTTTTSSLAASSGLSYGTAIRTIDDMVNIGLIARRARTVTGKSFSLHPSAELLRRWQIYAGVVRRLAGTVFSDDAKRPRRAGRSSERSSETATIIPPPAVLKTKLALARGLRVLVHADPTFMAMNALKRQFELILGVEIHSRALSIDRLRRAIIVNSEARVSDYDVVACDLPWFGEMASRGRLRPLDDLIAGSSLDLADFVPDAVASARWRGVQYGIPVVTTAEMLAYRTDLLADQAMEPPRTIADLIASAERLHRPEIGRAGLAWNAGRGTALGHTFITVMAAHGQPIVDLARTADGFDVANASGDRLRPMFLSEAAQETAEALSAWLALSPPDILSMVWYERARAYASGRSALAYSHTLLANLVERDANSVAHGKTGYTPHPTARTGRPVAPLGGYALAIPANLGEDRVQEVWSAIVALTSASAAKLYILNGSVASPRFSVNRDPEVAALSPVIGVVDDLARRGVLRMWPRPPVPGISTAIQIAGEEIHDMLLGLKSVRSALADAQARAEAELHAEGTI